MVLAGVALADHRPYGGEVINGWHRERAHSGAGA